MSKQDQFVIGICVILILVFSSLIYLEFNSRVDSKNRQAVGVISFRYRVAQRRPANSVIWNDIDQNDTAFNHDSIRTDDRSEAIIKIKEGPTIELDSNSMVVIHISEENSNEHDTIDIKKGSVLIRKGDSDSNDFTFKFEDYRISNIKSRVRFFRKSDSEYIFSGDGFNLDTPNTTSSIDADTILEFSQGKLKQKTVTLKTVNPSTNARYFSRSEKMNVSFDWQGPDKVQLMLANNPDLSEAYFEKMISKKETISLKEGVYFYKLISGELESITSKFRIIRIPALVLYSPIRKSYSTDETIQFAWQKSRLASKYELYISMSNDFTDNIIQRKTRRNTLSIRLNPGTYYWRLKGAAYVPAASTAWTYGTLVVSEKKSSVVSEKNEPIENSNAKKIPGETESGVIKKDVVLNPDQNQKVSKVLENKPYVKTRFPRSGMTIDMSKRNNIPFRWQGNGRLYSISLYNVSKGNQLVFNKGTTATSYVFSNLALLDVGKFRWVVTVLKDNQVVSKTKGVFRIILSDELDQPELDIQ